jgi:hypothetical protein
MELPQAGVGYAHVTGALADEAISKCRVQSPPALPLDKARSAF